MGADMSVVAFSDLSKNPSEESDFQVITDDALLSVMNLDDTHIDCLLGSHASMASYLLTLKDANSEPFYFSFNANVKDSYCVSEEFDEIVLFLQQRLQCAGHGKVSPSQIGQCFLAWFRQSV